MILGISPTMSLGIFLVIIEGFTSKNYLGTASEKATRDFSSNGCESSPENS